LKSLYFFRFTRFCPYLDHNPRTVCPVSAPSAVANRRRDLPPGTDRSARMTTSIPRKDRSGLPPGWCIQLGGLSHDDSQCALVVGSHETVGTESRSGVDRRSALDRSPRLGRASIQTWQRASVRRMGPFPLSPSHVSIEVSGSDFVGITSPASVGLFLWTSFLSSAPPPQRRNCPPT